LFSLGASAASMGGDTFKVRFYAGVIKPGSVL